MFGDLKPANILRTAPCFYRLVDLGLVSYKGTKFSQRIAVFSPKYGAPERGQGGAADPIHDIYSFGATVYFAMVGKEPGSRLSEDQKTRLVARVIAEETDWNKESQQAMAELLSLSLAALDPDPYARPPNIGLFKQSWDRCREVRDKDAGRKVGGSADDIVRKLYKKK